MATTTALFRKTAIRVLLTQALVLLGLWLLQRHYTV
jgi:hypothetical protein